MRSVYRFAPACLLSLVVVADAAEPTPQAEPPYPALVTAATRADANALAALEKPGKLLFEDGFESADSLKRYFEVRGGKEGRAKCSEDAKLAHSGHGALQLIASDRDGKESGAGVSYWYGPDGYDRIHLRRYIKFAADYDQGNLNHVGGDLAGIAGTNKYAGMGQAGIRPKGDDRFTANFEPWRGWGRYDPPGYMFLYTYWMNMKRDKDGHYWGNNLEPDKDERIALKRDRWYCLEHMIKANDVGETNGELAAWIDGKLYIHYRGFRWRSTSAVKLKAFHLNLYVHQAKRDNTVWYDDVALSTGYIGSKGE